MENHIKPCINLRFVTVRLLILGSEPLPHPDKLATLAARVFLSHEARLKEKQLASKLNHVTFLYLVTPNDGPATRQEHVFYRTWDSSVGRSVQDIPEMPAEAADCPWRLGVWSRCNSGYALRPGTLEGY